MAIGAVLLSLSGPAGLSRDGYIVLVMSIVATILFITEPIPLPTVSLLIISGQVLIAASGFDRCRAQPDDRFRAVHHGLADAGRGGGQAEARQAHRLADRAADRHQDGAHLFRHSVVSGLLASFVGEHTVAAMMLPVGITLITLTSDDPKKVRNLAAVLLFSICYGCSVAGIGTPRAAPATPS